MKVFSVLIICFFSTLPSFGQSLEGQDSTHYWTWNEYDWLHRERNLYTYDAQGRISTILRVERYMDPWKILSLQKITYDDDGDIINRLFQHWNDTLFLNSNRLVYLYDGNKKLIEVSNQDWDNDEWHPNSKEVLEYDGQSNLIKKDSYWWSGTDWVADSKQRMEYDDQNNLTALDYFSWDGMQWIGFFRFLYTYDQEDRVIQYISQSWDTAWINSSQEIYSFNTNGDQEIILHHVWFLDEWKTESRILNEYNINHQLLKSVYQKPTLHDWFDQYQTLYTYDTLGNELMSLLQSSFQDKWVNEKRNTKTYDQFQNLISGANQEWTDKWVYVDSTYHYFPFVSGTKDLAPKNIASIYPNPATTTLSLIFEYNQPESLVTIISSNGIKMMEVNVSGLTDVKLDLGHLLPGNYYVMKSWKNGQAVQPFVKLDR